MLMGESKFSLPLVLLIGVVDVGLTGVVILMMGLCLLLVLLWVGSSVCWLCRSEKFGIDGERSCD